MHLHIPLAREPAAGARLASTCALPDHLGVRVALPPIAFALLVAACPGDDDVGGGTAATSSASPTGTDTGTSAAGDDGSGTPTTGGPASTTTSSPTTTAPTGSDSGSPTGGDTTTAGTGDPGHYLLTVDTAASPPALVRIDLDAVGTAVVCEFPNNVTYNSVIFSRDGTLYGHNQGQARLDTINPCNCGFQLVGPTSAGALVLTLGGEDELYALEPGLDAFLEVDLDTGLANVLGPLAIDFVGVGAAWSDNLTGVYAVNDADDALYAIDDQTGMASQTVGLGLDVTTPGLAVHPDGDFWLCSGSTLHQLDPLTGIPTEAGALTLAGACSNLTAPQTSISCLD